MAEQRMLTPEQVADRLQISRVTVMDSLRKRRLKGYGVGRLWRIKQADLEAFLEGSIAESQADAPGLDEALARSQRVGDEKTLRALGC